MSTAAVLDEVDDASAQLIIALQLNDFAIERAYHTTVPGDLDEDIAREHQASELEQYHQRRGLLEDTSQILEAVPSTISTGPTVPYATCLTCTDEFPSENLAQTPCGHQFCGECIQGLFRYALDDQSLYPPRCCRQPVVFDDVRQFLEEPLATEFVEGREERNDPQPLYCAVSTCSAYIPADWRLGHYAICSACRQLTCMSCRQIAHQGDCPPDEAEQAVRDLAGEQMWQTCSACHAIVELRTGCNHITYVRLALSCFYVLADSRYSCRCGHHFCYVCGQQWRTCNCASFNRRRLREHAELVAQREHRRDVRVVEEQLRERHECDHEHFVRIEEPNHRCDDCRDTLTRFIYRCEQCRIEMCYRCRFHGL
ncbi:putative E3 ubiquitin-protein ligase ARI3 [Pseudocercospora fuligena]|uniref:Putative E3 ubiquitin-protein ligase ARI3 n=1 Tax=Pseudocercospora fuligena TaxID=685502 RepID=A0A8H6R7X3_9PEZI|nr:putative E3 ubiquitin-protein ligase ARI3 [Pseudocercospora fuligena]